MNIAGYLFNKTSIEGMENKVLTYHRITEAFKFAYAKRSELGDEDFVDVIDVSRQTTKNNINKSNYTKNTSR